MHEDRGGDGGDDDDGGRSFSRPDAYDRHVGRYGADLAAGLIARAEVGPGYRVLDVGCGPGALTRALAGVVSAELVSAVDPSEPFVAACQARVPGADVRVAAAEDLPFEDGTFDAVLSQLVLSFLADTVAGVGEMRRVARPGAAVGAAVWDYAGEMTVLRAFWDAAREVDPDRAEALDEGVCMRYCTPPELLDLWETAGLNDVAVTDIVVSAAYDDFEDLWWPFAAGVGPSGAYCVSLDEPLRNQLRARFHAHLGSPAGPFELTARAWAVVGRR